jgi:predicted DNA-binding protein (MmcQ/YjbR family)
LSPRGICPTVLGMDANWVRDLCLSFPGATEHVIWGNDLTFKVAGKMFAHAVLEPAPVWLSFKTSPEKFFELTERPDIIPAPYLARAQWVALQKRDALSSNELTALLHDSYDLIVAKLPKKIRDSMAEAKARSSRSSRRRSRSSK